MENIYTYKEIKNTVQGVHFIFRVEDSVYIPLDEANFDYREYLEWLVEGNEPEVIEETVKA